MFTSDMPVTEVKTARISAAAASPSTIEPMGAVLDKTLGNYLPGPVGDIALGPLVVLEILLRAFASAGLEIIAPAVGLSLVLALLLRRRRDPTLA